MRTFVLAGGCFWCLDAVYRTLKGVHDVVSGYTGGHMVRELVHHGYKVRACLRDATSWRGEDAIQCAPRPSTSHRSLG